MARRHRLARILLLCLAPFALLPHAVESQTGGTVSEMPPRIAEEVVEFLEWALQTPLAEEQRRAVADSLRSGWARGVSGDIAGTRALHAARDSVGRMSPRDREAVRPSLERQFVRGFRQQPNHPAAREFLPAYAARNRSTPRVAWPGETTVAQSLVAAPSPAPAPGAASSPVTDRSATPTAAAVPPIASGTAPPTIYYRGELASSIWGGGAVTYFLVLFPDGRYYRGFFPAEGLETFDWNHWCAKQGNTCGTYTLATGTTRGRQEVRTRSRQGTEEVLEVVTGSDGASAGRLRSFLPLERLDGLRPGSTYHVDCFTGYRPTVQFTREGRFTERELLGCAWLHLRGDFYKDYETYAARKAYVDANSSGSGTYSIRANTLELRYTNGRVIHLGLHVPPGWTPAAGDPPQLCIGDRNCLERVR